MTRRNHIRVSVLALGVLFGAGDGWAACGGEIKFAPGESQAFLKGAVKGYDFCGWRFAARAGQKVTVWLSGSDYLETHLYSQDGEEFANGEPITLGRDGRHEIRVMQPRSEARRNNPAKAFTIRVAITDR